jgi:nicotinamidase/pyrazinamidase
LNTAGIDHVVQKGTDRNIDSYSGFFDNARRKATGLEQYLRGRGADEVHIVGLATDYCVKFTALDAVSLGFNTTVLSEGVRGVELSPGDCRRALEEMRTMGVSIE